MKAKVTPKCQPPRAIEGARTLKEARAWVARNFAVWPVCKEHGDELQVAGIEGKVWGAQLGCPKRGQAAASAGGATTASGFSWLSSNPSWSYAPAAPMIAPPAGCTCGNAWGGHTLSCPAGASKATFCTACGGVGSTLSASLCPTCQGSGLSP